MTATRVVLQARISSSRLPAKSLLPVQRTPMAVLAALRAGRDGLDVVLATSDDPSDDPLAALATAAGVAVVRGSLYDPLDRFVAATADLPAGSVVVRLTGDNVVPDADLLRSLLAARAERDAGYLAISWPGERLPYGVSAEAFTVDLLRRAAVEVTASSDREHVTPWIRRQAANTDPVFTEAHDRSGFRCTVDTLADYLAIVEVFEGVDDPVAVPWRELLANLEASQTRRLDGFVLGTAQLGLDYGITNTRGMPSRRLANDILRRAAGLGVAELDTARAYGDSERRIGEAGGLLAVSWGVTTKLTPEAVDTSTVDASVLRSLHELQVHRLDTVLLHRADQHRTAVWDRLLELRADGMIAELGVSVASPEELARVVDDPDVRQVQLPFNLLDRRWQEVVPLLEGRADLEVRARSALLQGLLAAGSGGRWPTAPGFEPDVVVTALDELVRELGRADVADLCFAYVRAQPWLDRVVVGVASTDELEEDVARFGRPPLSAEACRLVEERVPGAPPEIVDPARWTA